MAIKITPLTKRQLVGYFNDYRLAFPDWRVEHDVVLARSHGPVEQRISFEALRSGAIARFAVSWFSLRRERRCSRAFLDISIARCFRESTPRSCRPCSR